MELMAMLLIPAVVVLGPLLVVALVLRHRRVRADMRYQFLLKLAESGAALPSTLPGEATPRQSDLRRALVLLAGGLGLIGTLLALPLHYHVGRPLSELWGVGILPIALGLGYLAHWFLSVAAAGMDEGDAQARLDAALVERAVRHADRRAFELLVRRHQGLVRAQLRRLLGHDSAMADDLAQETFVLAWRKLDQFRGESRFATWLYRIAHTCFLQFLRRQGGQTEPVALDDEAHPVAADPHDLALRLDLAAALQQLPTSQRAALLYCVQLGLSHQEAADVLDMPLGTVKTHVLRGKARLRELLQAWATNPEPDHDAP